MLQLEQAENVIPSNFCLLGSLLFCNPTILIELRCITRIRYA